MDRLAFLKQKLKEKKVSHFALELESRKRKFSDMAEEQLNDTWFLELFAGEAGLTAAVRRAGGLVHTPGDIHVNDRTLSELDLTDNQTFKKIKQWIKRKKIRWLHLAPPCRTFTRARRSDRIARVRKLRSHSKPEGFDTTNPLVKEANLLAARSAQLAALQHKAGGWFSIENPLTSFIWLLKPLKRLTLFPGIFSVEGDQCRFGGEYVKPTCWLTNSEHLKILQKRCPGEPTHVHPKLTGFTSDFFGNQVFKTSLAAEYPQGLCEELAKEFLLHVTKLGARAHQEEVVIRDGQKKPNYEDKSWLREQENEDCIGGLRNPVFSLNRVPGWRLVGMKLFQVLTEAQHVIPRDVNLLHFIGQTDVVDLEKYISMVRARLAKEFKLDPRHNSGIWGRFLSRIVQEAGDPDEEVATWPDKGTPLGIEEKIPSGGVFPLVDQAQFPQECNRLNLISGLFGAEGNYTTYLEHKQEADDLFLKEVANGFAEWSEDKSTLEAKYGKLVQSSIGVIVKQKREVKKVRLVHDLRRSGINETIRFQERLVLPRLRDVVEDAMILYESKEKDEVVRLLSLDFKDAFKQLPVRHNEKRYLSGMAAGGFFVYHVVLFGIRTGPLVWARMAALVARASQSLFADDRCRLQIYVDDPLLLMRGRVDQIEDMASKVLWLWLSMGLKISWSKGTFGTSVGWIGAEIRLDEKRQAIHLTITEEKLEEWKELLSKLDHKPVVSKKLLMQFTGKMSWASGFIHQLRPFVRMLHTALAMESKVTRKGAVYHKQVEPALLWFQHFFNGLSGGLHWMVQAHVRHICSLEITVDASPWGGGAVKYRGGQPEETLSLVWTSEDERLTGAKIGEPGSQALWECYMVLRALWCWLKLGQQGYVRIRGDAEGVLAALLRRSAKSPLLNTVVREITLLLARDFRSLETIHVWSEYNELADALSRIKDPNKPAVFPAELMHLKHHEDAPQYWQGSVVKSLP